MPDPTPEADAGPEPGAPRDRAVDSTADRAATIKAFHDDLDGPSWRVAGWGSAELQRARFDALVRACGYRGGSVLDLGCGPADLYFHLRELGLPLHYTGVDIDPRMVELARSRGAPGIDLVALDHLDHVGPGNFDYVLASGIFQFRDPADPLYHLNILDQGYDISRRAIAANLLSALRPEHDKAADELYADPATIARFAAAVTDRWTIDHSYHPHAGDFTIALLK
jgi:SAM-dependent methyltransferase